ncbi:MAG: uracil-DNA glycosylase family protein [Isosphaeraceae bacterium]
MEPRLEALLDRVQAEARREEFPVDVAVYRSAGKDPGRPILCAGSLNAPVCVVGRDLGKDEVRQGQPLIGAGGSLVRRGVLESWGHPDLARGGRKELEAALEYVLLTNTVPYKPPGNKAYSEGVKDRFRPFLAELLTVFWTGVHVITLGTEAFRWFEPFGDSEAFETVGTTDRRFETSFECQLPTPRDRSESPARKACRILPLPHPSPLNRRWTAAFPGMLARRLADIRAAVEGA